MEHTEIKVEVNATTTSTQVSPQDVSVTLRPGTQHTSDVRLNLIFAPLRYIAYVTEYICVFLGGEASVIVAVKQLQRYPVDLYYLVDVSASMQENLDHVRVKTLSQRCLLFSFFFFSCIIILLNTDNNLVSDPGSI